MVFLSLSGSQVKYFLFLWVSSFSPFPGNLHPLLHTLSWPPAGYSVSQLPLGPSSKSLRTYFRVQLSQSKNMSLKVPFIVPWFLVAFFVSYLTFRSLTPCWIRLCVRQAARAVSFFVTACDLWHQLCGCSSGLPRWACCSRQTWSAVHETLFLLRPHSPLQGQSQSSFYCL